MVKGRDGDEKIKRKRKGKGSRDVVLGLEKEELTCPAVYPSIPRVFHPCCSTILLTSCEFKQLSFCEVIPNALK